MDKPYARKSTEAGGGSPALVRLTPPVSGDLHTECMKTALKTAPKLLAAQPLDEACGGAHSRLGFVSGEQGPAMLIVLRTGLSFRLAAALAAVAALCFVAPPAVVAFGHGSHTMNCVAHADMINHGAVKRSGRDSHAGHSAPTGSHPMTCCGLFCLSALPTEVGWVIGGSDTGLAISPAPAPHLLTQSPERPDRPPISPLFV